MLKNYVNALDIEAEEAEDGCKALARLGEEDASEFDVAMVDWDMPHMNGIEFVSELRACPEFNAMKVMMVTSHNDPEDLMKAIEKGADEFLMKPFDQDMVGEKLRILGLLN